MTNAEERGRILLPSVLVLGGGRWARVMTEVLLTIVTDDTPVQMASPAGAPDLAGWLQATGRSDRIVLVERDQAHLPPGSAVLVANAARSHVESALWALARNLPVLVEKPMALTTAAAERLRAAANEQGTLIAPALVFGFVSGLEHLAVALAGRGPTEHVELIWVDPAAELRHGEAKRYDPGVSVLEDCLPHVVAVLNAAFGTLPQMKGLTLERGGAKVRLLLADGEQNYGVVLERNGGARQRLVLAAFGPSGTAELDFSIEPGTLRRVGLGEARAVPAATDGALATMIRAFLTAATGGRLDPRLSLGPALHAAELTETAMARYRDCLLVSLNAGLAEPDLDYAVSELLQRDGRLSSTQAEAAAHELRRQLTEGAGHLAWSGIEAAVHAARALARTRSVH